jgi:hypothetical protein
LGGGSDDRGVLVEPLVVQECAGQDPVRALDRKHAGRSAPSHVRVYRTVADA